MTSEVQCPKCADDRIARSRLRLVDRLNPAYLLGRRPYRCQMCQNRFWRVPTKRPTLAE